MLKIRDREIADRRIFASAIDFLLNLTDSEDANDILKPIVKEDFYDVFSDQSEESSEENDYDEVNEAIINKAKEIIYAVHRYGIPGEPEEEKMNKRRKKKIKNRKK